jgi:hypothetical protein
METKHEQQEKKRDKLSKRKLITRIAIGGCSALVFAGVGVGIGYVIFNKKVKKSTTTDAITFGTYHASMSSGSQQISAYSSIDKPITLSASGDEQGTA